MQTRGGISPCNIAGLISDVFEEVATQIAKNCRRQQPHCYLTPPPRGTPANIRICLIFLETRIIGLHFCRRQYGSIFIRLAVVASQKCELAQNSAKIWTYSSSRSSKVIDFGTNRKRIHDFLLVINSNHGPILNRFWDTATYWLKIAYFSYPSYWSPRSLWPPWNFGVKLTMRKVESWGYWWWKLHDPIFNRFWLIHPCDGRTDRQTDGRAIA